MLMIALALANAFTIGRVLLSDSKRIKPTPPSNIINSYTLKVFKTYSIVDLKNLITYLANNFIVEERERKLKEELELKREEERRKIIRKQLEARFTASSILRDFYSSGRMLSI